MFVLSFENLTIYCKQKEKELTKTNTEWTYIFAIFNKDGNGLRIVDYK